MKKDTKLIHAGRSPKNHFGAVNIPAYRVSTVLFPDVQALHQADAAPFDKMSYGRQGTPTSFALEETICAMEGGYRTISTGSGLAAISSTLQALLSAGDHILVSDSVYFPTRNYCNRTLSRFGVEVTYYDPLIGGDIAQLIQPNTKLIYTESPGSQTFEVQDIPAIAAAAHKAQALVVMDNTWATPLYFDALAKGVDVSVQALTKYAVGHSDAMLGSITCKSEDIWRTIKNSVSVSGIAAGSEELYLGLRGLRTLAVRLRQHHDSGLQVASWLEQRPEVARVIHPALPGNPGYDLWKRDFSGACGLFAIELNPCPETAVEDFVNGLSLFGLGYSWGGFESLVIPSTGKFVRTASYFATKGPMLRFHIGLEDVSDLIEDLENGFTRLRKSANK